MEYFELSLGRGHEYAAGNNRFDAISSQSPNARRGVKNLNFGGCVKNREFEQTQLFFRNFAQKILDKFLSQEIFLGL